MNITMELASIMFTHVKPNTTMSVVEARREDGQVILTLEHPDSRRLADFPLVSTLQPDDKLYLVLYSQDTYAEPPQSNYALVKYIDSRRLMTIGYEEFQPLYNQVQLETEPDSLGQSCIKFFHLPADQATIDFQNKLREELTSQIQLGGLRSEPPGTILKVAKRACNGRDVWIEFPCRLEDAKAEFVASHGLDAWDQFTKTPESKDASFLLLWVKVLASGSYCIFDYPPQLIVGDSVRRKVVLRFRDRDTFEVLSPEELRRVRGDLIAALAPDSTSGLEEIEAILGQIPRRLAQ